MTLLISILAITNMAIGYGLAVYLGHGRKPVQITLGRSRKSKAAVASPPEEISEQVPVETEPTPVVEEEMPAEQTEQAPTPEQVPQLDVKDLMPDAGSKLVTEATNEATAPEPTKTDELVEKLAEATPEETADEPVVEAPVAEEPIAQEEAKETAIEPPAQEVVSEQIVEKDEEIAKVIESNEQTPTEEPEEITEEANAEESMEEVVEKEVDDLESLSQQLQSAVAESGDEPEVDTAVAEDDAEDASVEVTEKSDTKKAPAEALPEVEALEGIEAFQAQLKEQQAVAEEPATETEQANGPPDADALAGIDSFREQLAKM